MWRAGITASITNTHCVQENVCVRKNTASQRLEGKKHGCHKETRLSDQHQRVLNLKSAVKTDRKWEFYKFRLWQSGLSLLEVMDGSWEDVCECVSVWGAVQRLWAGLQPCPPRSSPQEKEMEKQRLLYQQSRLHNRGAAEMVLQMISACKGAGCTNTHTHECTNTHTHTCTHPHTVECGFYF